MVSIGMAKLQHTHQPLQLSLNHSRPSFPNPISTLRPTLKPLSIRASISSNPSPTPKPSPLVRTTCAAIAAAAFFLARFSNPAVAAVPVAPPPRQQTVAAEETLNLELLNNVEELRLLMETKIRANKFDEAVDVIDRLIELDPDDFEWPLLKANLHSHMGEIDLARAEFEEILKKDPLRVEAFHGLVISASQAANGSPDSMKQVTKRVEEAMKRCERMRNTSDARDFKLLIAQIRVMESNYNDALKLYKELAKDEPRDFRPYLCQGIIYSLMKKKNEAEEQFNIFRRLVPKNHPYKEYFDDNMFATKLFSYAEKEATGSQS